MFATSQKVVPYTFVEEVLGVGTATIAWLDEYDGYLEFLVASAESTSTAAAVVIQTSTGVQLGVALLGGASSTGEFSRNQPLASHLPAGSVLQVLVDGQSCSVSVSGYLLDPPRTSILPGS